MGIKKILFGIGLPLIVFMVFWIFFFREGLVSTKPGTSAKPSALDQNKFELNIKRNLLLDADGRPFLLKGVTVDYFRYPQAQGLEVPYIKNVSDLINYLDIVHKWGANTIQVYVNPDLFDSLNPESVRYFDDLKQVVDWGYKNNVWVILNPVNDTQWVDDLPVANEKMRAKSDKIAIFLKDLSRIYKDKGNVIFGLEAEPKLINNSSIIDERLDAISSNSGNPILVPFGNFSGSTDILSEVIKQGKKNIIVDYHPYRARNDASSQNLPAIKDILTYIGPDVYINYPTIFGEFGGFWQKDFNSINDVKYLTEIGDLAEKYNVSFSAYSLDNINFPMFDGSGNINIRGEAVKKLLEN